jgi:futalosine hydrolase
LRVLLVAATDAEIAPVRTTLRPDVTVLVTGVGMVATAVRCARELARGDYELAINVGVCGSFNPVFPPGRVVHIGRDQFSELGAEDDDRFLSLLDLKLLGADDFPYTDGVLVNREPPLLPALVALPTVCGITVNTAHGNAAAIDRVVSRCHPDVESMEGAAFMYACLVQGIPFAQVRAVSNVVERRNRPAWKLTEAVRALGDVTVKLLEQV